MQIGQIVEITRPEIRQALKEDCPAKDITTSACISPSSNCSAIVIAKSPLVVSGLAIVKEVFRQADKKIRVKFIVKDGVKVKAGRKLMEISGKSAPLLRAERVALNYMQRMCGIATLTSEFVKRVKGTKAKILDTRKTTPNLRALEKYAVTCGGGFNHRMSLSDQPMIKENHIRAAGSITNAVKLIKGSTRKKIIVETTNRAEVIEALEAGVGIILLDNMSPLSVAKMVKLIGGKADVEVSGGVTLRNVRSYAVAGAKRISVGAITHSAPSADISLLFN